MDIPPSLTPFFSHLSLTCPLLRSLWSLGTIPSLPRPSPRAWASFQPPVRPWRTLPSASTSPWSRSTGGEGQQSLGSIPGFLSLLLPWCFSSYIPLTFCFSFYIPPAFCFLFYIPTAFCFSYDTFPLLGCLHLNVSTQWFSSLLPVKKIWQIKLCRSCGSRCHCVFAKIKQNSVSHDPVWTISPNP